MKNILLSMLVLFMSLSVFAQKDAPVAGHAAALVDFLKKNYSSLDPEMRDEEFARDRANVISIFKIYLGIEEKDEFSKKLSDNKNYNSKLKVLTESLKVYNASKKELAAYSSLNVTTVPQNSHDLPGLINRSSFNVDEKKKSYFEQRYNIDKMEMAALRDNYSSTNKFVSSILELFEKKYDAIQNHGVDAYASATYSSSLQKSIPFIGGNLGFETYVDGLSRFLAKRIKEELTTYVLEQVKTWLQNPSPDDPLAEFKVLLPRTTSFLNSFSADKLSSLPNELRQYIEDDLNNILESSAGLPNTPRIRALLMRYPKMEFAFESLQIIPALSNVKHPIDYFMVLDNSPTLRKWKADEKDFQLQNIANLIQMAGMIANSMIVIENDEPRFAGSTFLRTYASETTFLKLYTGFLFQQNANYYNISFNRKSKNSDSLETEFAKVVVKDKIEDKLKEVVTFTLTEIGSKGEKVFNTALEIRQAKKTGKKVGADTIHAFVKSVLDLSERVIISADLLARTLVKVNGKEPSPISPEIKPYFALANSGNDIVFDLQKKKYATALMKSLEMTSKAIPQSSISALTVNLRSLVDIYPNENFKNWNKIIVALKPYFAGKDETKIKSTDLEKYLTPVNTELFKIRYFYSDKYGDLLKDTASNSNKTTLRNIEKVHSLFRKFEAKNFPKFTDTDVIDVNAFINSANFKTVVVSYYTNTAIELIASNIAKEMHDLHINNANIFKHGEDVDVKLLIEKYAVQIYVNYIEKGAKDIQTPLKNAKADLDRITQGLDFTVSPKLISLVNFVNGMASAESAEEVEDAIEAFALPAGSYSIKRKSAFNLAVNSYPGILIGGEKSWTPGKDTLAFAPAFTAPVGLSFTWGWRKGKSLGFFLPIIDIGALTRFRLDGQNNTKTLPEFSFSNIFSPGLYGHLGFKKNPLTLYFGAQYGPDLKEISIDPVGNSISKSYESIRLNLGLVLDIPLFNLHTKSRL